MKDSSHSIDSDPVVEAYKKDVDRTLIRENLKLTDLNQVEERFLKAMALQRFAEELRRAGREVRSQKPAQGRLGPSGDEEPAEIRPGQAPLCGRVPQKS